MPTTRVPAYIELFAGVPTLRGLMLFWSARSAALDFQYHESSLFGNAPGFVPQLRAGYHPLDMAVRLDMIIIYGNGQGYGTSTSLSKLGANILLNYVQSLLMIQQLSQVVVSILRLKTLLMIYSWM